jgi:peptidoglycan/LPS O-acetylase OafA/YrhL
MRKERKKRLYKLAGWSWSWVATMAIASFGPKYIWDNHAVLTVLAVCVNFANGILMLVANRNLFNDFDELERKIHLEAMALTLGLAVVAGLSYSLIDITDLIPFDADIGFLVMFIGITYLICVAINTKKYN